ncbi:MAG: hypothetical protein WDM94_09180 [Bauldia sp.]
MDFKRKGSYLEITEGAKVVRIDSGPVKRRATATDELLANDKSNAKYHAPRKVKVRDLPTSMRRPDGIHFFDRKARTETVFDPKADGNKEVTVYAIDAHNVPIELGKPMTYIDRMSDEREFFVYQQVTEGRQLYDRSNHPMKDAAGAPVMRDHTYFKEVAGPFPNEEAALGPAMALIVPTPPAKPAAT